MLRLLGQMAENPKEGREELQRMLQSAALMYRQLARAATLTKVPIPSQAQLVPSPQLLRQLPMAMLQGRPVPGRCTGTNLRLQMLQTGTTSLMKVCGLSCCSFCLWRTTLWTVICEVIFLRL